MRSTTRYAVMFALACAACSSDNGTNNDDDDDDGDNNPPTGAMTAKIDGVSWASSAQSTGTYNASTNTYVIVGAELGISPARAILITLAGVNGAGTYTLNSGAPFRYANVTSNGLVWETSVTGGAATGTVVVTTATAHRFAGTFSFTGAPAGSSPGATGTKTVTNGTFDVAIP